MSTLSSYVEGLRGPDDLVFAAPTRISEYRDQRRLKVTWLPPIAPPRDGSASLPPLTTDFYELYWANLVVGSEWRHVTSWLFGLVPRWRRLGPRLRRFLRYHFGYAVALLVLAVVLFLASMALPGVFALVAQVVGGLLVPGATGWLVWHLGDVARYVNHVADNVTIQRAVRSEGLELLRQLHDRTYGNSKRPMYDRIVVVGHSLGSVIAYDIVRDYWSEVYRYLGVGPDAPQELREVADAVDRAGETLWTRGVQAEGNDGFTEFQLAQRALSAHWPKLASLPPGEVSAPRWAITDLITLACPLTYADILLTTGAATVESMQWDRSLATCPPRRQRDRSSYRFTYAMAR